MLSEFICIALILVDETHKILITQEPSGQRLYNCWVRSILLLLLILMVVHYRLILHYSTLFIRMNIIISVGKSITHAGIFSVILQPWNITLQIKVTMKQLPKILLKCFLPNSLDKMN